MFRRSIPPTHPRAARILLALGIAAVLTLSVFGHNRHGARATPATASSGTALSSLPAGWPSTLQIGQASGANGAAAMKATAPYGFRYQYLAGGVNTGSSWATWNANGGFVTNYIQDSVNNGITPVFSYYMMYQSAPGNAQSEPAGVYANLANTSTMQAYFGDMKLFFQKAGAFPATRVVLHDEPDLWGFIEQHATNDNAATVPAAVGGTGMSELAGLPDNASGFARAIVKLRDLYAPNVIVAYHMSPWGAGTDLVLANPSDAGVDALALKAANFYNSLGARFDMTFVDASDRDAGFKQYVYGDGGAAWWDAGDYARSARMLGGFSVSTNTRIVIWQIPLGNTRMRAVNNTTGHYQDNHVEWLLDDASRAHLTAYRDAGVVAFLFGGGASGTTCACDSTGDGVTNPAPINGNNTTSLTADDDGGFFKQKVQAYFGAGAMPLGGRDHKTDSNSDGYSDADEGTVANCGAASCASVITLGTGETNSCQDSGRNCGSAPASSWSPLQAARTSAGGSGTGCSTSLDTTGVLKTATLARSDIDLDGSVSILDLAKTATWFNNPVGDSSDPRWEANLNGDSSISILDLSAAAANFGRSVSANCKIE